MARKLCENPVPKNVEKVMSQISEMDRLLNAQPAAEAPDFLGERWWLVGQKDGYEPDIMRLSAETRAQLERKMERINIRPAEGVRFAVAHVRLYAVKGDEPEIHEQSSVGSSVFGAMVRQVTA